MKTGARLAALALLSLSFGACVTDLDFYTKGHSASGSGSDSSGSTGVSTSNTSSAGGGEGTGTTSGTGGTGGCTPGVSAPCYDGPPETEGLGLCKGGMKTCEGDGVTYGPCTGQILPKPEDCATATDEDCDGLAPPCKGTPLWSKRFGDGSTQAATSIAVDGAGNVVVAGYFSGSINFGGNTLQSAGGQDIFVAKLDPNGGHLWSKRFGDAATQGASSVAIDSSGHVLLTGYMFGSADFGGGPLVSTGAGMDVFVAKLSPDGNHLWSKHFGDVAYQAGSGIAVDGTGNVLVTGNFNGALTFGGNTLQSAGGVASGDVFLAKLDSNGAHVWSKGFGGVADQIGKAVATDATGNVIVVGVTAGVMDFGGGGLLGAGGADVFVAELDPAGDHVWSKMYGDAAEQDVAGLGLDLGGNVLLVGSFAGSMDFGGSLLLSAGTHDVFLAKLDSNGAHVWSKSFGDIGEQNGRGVVVDPVGNILVAGTFDGAIDFGGGPLQSAGGGDIFLAKLDAMGAHVWSKRFGDSASQGQLGTAIAADAMGKAFLVGSFMGSVNFGDGPLQSAGGNDVFVAAFAP